MDERSEELEGPELALLELYRDASGPSAEVEDRLLARIQAQAAVEADLADDDRALLGAAASESTAADPSVRPLTAAVIAIVAFAAGVALTWGLRGDLLAVDADRDTPSVSPMTAEGVRAHEVHQPSAPQACGPVVVEKRVEVPVPVRADDRDDEDVDDDRDREGPIAAPPSSGWDEADDEPTRGGDDEPILRQRTIAMAPWSPPSSSERGSGTEPRRGSSRRGSRGVGIYGPTGTSPSRPGKPSAGTQGSSGSSTPGSNGGNRGPGNDGGNRGPGNDGGSDPGGNDGDGTRPPPPADPNDSPPPPTSPGNDDEPPKPEDPPRDDEPPPTEDDGMPDWQECEDQYMGCYDELMPWCDQDPVACSDAAYACEIEYQVCIDPWADVFEECGQQVGECYMEADAICLQNGQMEFPDQCMALYEQCELEYQDCLGAFGESEEEELPGQIYD